jgi:two-component sensor histidine kinase
LSQETQLGNSALMMKEVHHRVRNSLQLVQTLLALQANLAGDKSVATHLQAAATRVRTVGSVHHRLYQDDGAEATDATSYLRGLTADLAELAAGREVSLEGKSIVLPAARLAPLGLVTAELVTNALKYGRGTVRVTLERSDDAVLLTVEDEGDGFPIDFPKPQGTGLGMRLVTTYAGKGAGAVTVDQVGAVQPDCGAVSGGVRPSCPQPVTRPYTSFGLRSMHASGPRPSRSITPGRKPSISASA